jgi:2-keto-4-pentenoate hydratase/2-oxohepta-3-ene-1,7-dioic acid hydratase in catechol pathway
MALPRFGTAVYRDSPQVVVETTQGVTPLRELLGRPGPADMVELIRGWSQWGGEVIERSMRTSPIDVPLDADQLSWLAPVAPSLLVCVGTNYRDHVAEMAAAGGAPVVDEPFPFTFLKPAACLVGHNSRVAIPSHGIKLDWEAELAVVIGDPAKATSSDPLSAVFAYGVVNELSLRDFMPFPHGLGLDAVSAKAFPGAAPMGPWLTLREAVGDVQDLPVRLRVNGIEQQDSSTAEMIFGVSEIVRHVGRILSLSPGDVIATGTPAGVGAAARPQRFLAAGDTVEAEVGPLGTVRTTIVSGEPFAPLGSSKLAVSA